MSTIVVVVAFQFLCTFLGLKECCSSPVPNGSTFQKPHFQVEHKAGVLSIEATKTKATVDVKSDTIRLVVKPGDKQYPAQKSPDVKTVFLGSYQYPIQRRSSIKLQTKQRIQLEKS